jgi:oligosaccharide repeat unit polymerase
MFVPALSSIYLLGQEEKKDRKHVLLLVLCNGVAMLIPVLCVSKFQFALAIVLPAIIFLLMRPQIRLRYLLAGVVGLGLLFGAAAVFMTAKRHYEPGYLDSIFEMKDASMPVAFQYLYMYIANNYANFNELTLAIGNGSVGFTWGLRELFPVFALTGLKFVFPQLVSFALPVTKDTLNTLTIIYDAYYDFGVIGVAVFGTLLGIACRLLTEGVKNQKNPIMYLLYAQIAMYVMLSFFSAWFTVPTTWFWLALTGLMYVYTSVSRHRD